MCVGLLLAVSSVVLVWSFASSFRLNSDEIDLAWQANSTPLTILFAAGFAQCAGLTVLKARFGLSQHIRLYLYLVLICAGLMVASIMSVQIWLAVLSVVIAAVFAFYLGGKLGLQTSLGRLILGVILYAVFFLSIAVYFAASTQSDGVYGGLVLWLFSNAGNASDSAMSVLLLVIVLIASLIIVKEKDLLAISVIAVGIGLAGPLIFVGYFAQLVLPSEMDLRYKILMAGSLGGTFIVTTSSTIQLMFGGYAPGLITPLAFVFIPFALLCSGGQIESSRQAAYNQKNRNFERTLLAIIAAISLAVVLHVYQYAQGLI